MEVDETVMELKLEQQMYPRVDGISDEEWALVEHLLDPNWETRMSLTDAIDTLKGFADRELAAAKGLDVGPTKAFKVDNQETGIEVATATMWVCSYCTASMPIEFNFCGNCSGAPSSQAPALAMRRSCASCSGGVLSTDRFCRHCGLDLSS
ncbi:Serine/threonine protein kinase [Phytophthora cinnamomi]|uniref:Serine/threonine protein kinase n=1 Tax=Phytophthora cinnamomi TaxID=4785 RepID=UPI00355A18F8|nr:Serine/threonine protein kinase [Phytophthora cinnamomi]